MAQIQKGTTYSTGDQVTATNLNALADAAILLPGAITDQTAKTVPLAADTVLIHSAADTALRKSTLTQLFANATGIPISTGISGLGTGIATALAVNTGSAGAPVLFNGALGTPASGNLASCTGYVGTSALVTGGAMSVSSLASSGAVSGTTWTGTGQLSVRVDADTVAKFRSIGTYGAKVLWENIGTDAFSIEMPANTGNLSFKASGTTQVALLTSTGLNSTAIGATTASTGAFTFLSATASGAAIPLSVTNNTSNYGRIRISNSGSTAGNYRGYEIFNGSTFKGGILQDESTDAISVFVTGGVAQVFNADKSITMANGLAVTGALSSTTTLQAKQSTTNPASTGALPGLSMGFDAGAEVSWIQSERNSLAELRSLLLNPNGGNVGIGTTSPAVKLHVQSGSAGATALRLTDAVRGTINIDFPATSQIRFDVGAAEKTLFASGGNTYLTIIDANSGGGIAVTGQIAVGGATEAASIRSTFTGNTIDGISLKDSADQSNAVFAAFRKASGAAIGSITRVTTTDAVVYNTTSDGRLKENLRDFTDSGRLIDSLKPRVFDWKNSDENGKNVVGFIAQEEHAADPIFAHIGAVSVGDEDAETITKQWQRSDAALIPILVAELKALRQRVAALESN